MRQWEELELFTLENPGVSSAELAEREMNRLRDAGRQIARVTRKRQGKPKQITLDL